MRCFSTVFRNEQLKISTASKLTFKQQRAISSGFPVVFSPFPLSKLKRMFNIHVLGTSLGKCLNIQLKPEADLRLAKGRGTRREADSQVNISLYLKRPEHILKLLLIIMPTSHRPLSNAGGTVTQGEGVPGVFGNWSKVTVPLPAIISQIMENDQHDSRNRGCFSFSFSFWPLLAGTFNASHTGVWLDWGVWVWHS